MICNDITISFNSGLNNSIPSSLSVNKKIGSLAIVETFPIIPESTLERVHLNFSGEAGGEKYFNIV